MDKELYEQALKEQEACIKDKNRQLQTLWGLTDQLIQETLISKFPKVADNIRLGVAVRLGWLPLLETCLSEMNEIVEANAGYHIKIAQIKEKFGGLRIYAHFFSEGAEPNEFGMPGLTEEHKALSPKVMEIIHRAEDAADKTCDICGKEGHARSLQGWHAVRCDKHAK